jgi:hypothetical protein
MLSITESKYLFLFGCIPIRFFLSILPSYINEKLLFYYGFILLSISLSFFYLYFFNKRLNAFEAGGNTWWSKFRIIHAILYFCAAILSLKNKQIASLPLFIDSIFGLFIFIFIFKRF